MYMVNAMDYKATTKWLEMARVDIKNQGEGNDVKVTAVEGENCNITQPQWFSEYGVGYLLETCDRHLVLDLECCGSGELMVCLRGIDRRISGGGRALLWVDYTSLIVDKEVVFRDIQSLWHDKPYRFTREVSDGEKIRVEITWKPHEYQGAELDNLMFQLGVNAQSDYQRFQSMPAIFENDVLLGNAKISIDYLLDEIERFRLESPSKDELKAERRVYNSVEDLSYHLLTGPFSVKIDDVKFECFYHANEMKSKSVCVDREFLYVFYPPARSEKDPSPQSAHFTRWSYYPMIESVNGNLLCIDDPMIQEYEEKGLILGWFYGNRGKSYIRLSLEIIKAVCNNLHVSYENVIFFGSSAGGYCGLYAASFLKGSMAVAINPQIYIQQWPYTHKFEAITGISLKAKDYLHRNDLVSLIKGNNASKYVILFNAMGDSDRDLQLTPFCNEMEIFPHYGLNDKENVLLWIYSSKGTEKPHDASETRNIFMGIDSIAKRFYKGDKIKELQDFAVLINRYWEDYYKLKSTSPDNFMTFLMDTARIDIKLTGIGIHLGVSSSDVRASMSKPRWLQKNGEGYVITSYSKKMNLRIKTVGEGKLEIILKGPYVLNPEKVPKLIPYWIDYTSLKVNNIEQLKEKCSAWHDKTFVLGKNVSGENEFNVDISWVSHS